MQCAAQQPHHRGERVEPCARSGALVLKTNPSEISLAWRAWLLEYLGREPVSLPNRNETWHSDGVFSVASLGTLPRLDLFCRGGLFSTSACRTVPFDDGLQ